jgi:hypothetical protein
MFANAIEHVAQFVRPVHLITRNFQSEVVSPGAATLFFVNSEGWALSCGHVADLIVATEQINQKYAAYRSELTALSKPNRDARRNLDKKYGYSSKVLCQIKVRFIGCGIGEGSNSFEIQLRRHSKYDVALLHFSPAPTIQAYPKFATEGSGLKQGKYLCRLGFPFPEFANFTFDKATEQLDWTTSGQEHSPRFPIEGMVTRHMIDGDAIVAFEMSTPGLRGQSGGPAFDAQGVIWGMQSQTRHLDLDFDVDQEVLRQGVKERRRDSAFLHVGICAHVDVLKAFMREQSVQFSEAS